MTVRRAGPYVWVTWITGLLAGSSHCEWAAWFKANFQNFDKVERSFDLTIWTANHGAMVSARAEQLRVDGWTVYVEGQNKFTLRGTAAMLAGTPDIVAIKGSETLVIDCKTGKHRDGDLFQVLIYMMVLPLTHQACVGRKVAGELQYKENQSILIAPDRLTDSVRMLISEMIRKVASETVPERVPSFSECNFCDIGSDCPDRITKEPEVAVTALF